MIKLISFQVIVQLINFISSQVAFLIFIDMLLYLNVEPSQKLAKNRPVCYARQFQGNVLTYFLCLPT